MSDAVNITDSAKTHLNGLIEKQGKPIVRLRVKGGGCAGFQYEWLMTDKKEFDDEVIKLKNGEFAIDSMSMLYVIGTTIDYVEEIFGSSLTIKNPNATNSCGCGESVSF